MKKETKEKLQSYVAQFYVLFILVGIVFIFAMGLLESEQPKFQAQKVFTKYESAKAEEDKFAAIELKRCMDDGSNNADCRIKIALLAEQTKGESFKQKVAESLAKITSELDKKD